jgi:transposase
MPDNPIEILGARERRRRWSMEEKLRLVAECEEPGAVLRVVAAPHDVYPTLLAHGGAKCDADNSRTHGHQA